MQRSRKLQRSGKKRQNGMIRRWQIILAASLVGLGVILVFTSFAVPPTGIIDPSVLAAFGEILTFSGSIIGIDYHYQHKR